MKNRRKPPPWFKWAIWGGILLSVAVPSACVLHHGTVPGYRSVSLLLE